MAFPASLAHPAPAPSPFGPGMPMVPREKVASLLRYRLLDPLEDIAQEYADYSGRPVQDVMHSIRTLAENGSAATEGPDVHILPVQAALPHVLTRLQMSLTIALQFRGASYLDIGAGTGRDCIAFAKCGVRATHADLPSEAMDFAQWRYAVRRLNIPLVDVRQLPEQRYTIVSCHNVFEHVEDPVELIAQWVTHTDPGGMLCISLDLFKPLSTHLPKNNFYATLYDPLLRHLGMELILGHTSPVCDVANSALRIYQRTSAASLPVSEEFAALKAEAYTFIYLRLQELRQQLEAECERVGRACHGNR